MGVVMWPYPHLGVQENGCNMNASCRLILSMFSYLTYQFRIFDCESHVIWYVSNFRDQQLVSLDDCTTSS